MYGECGFPTWLGMLNISVYSASFILRRDIQTQKHILRACRELSRRKKTSYRRNFKFSDFSVRREGASDTLYPTEVLAQDGPGRVVPVARSLSQSPVAGSFGGFAGSTSMFCLFCRMKNEGFDGGAVDREIWPSRDGLVGPVVGGRGVVPVARSLSQSPVAGSFGGFAGSTSMF